MTIETNLWTDEQNECRDSNVIVYEDEYVSLWYAGKQSDNEYVFIVRNNCGYNTSYTIQNCSVNEWSYNTYLYYNDVFAISIHDNAYSVFKLDIDESFLSANEINDVKNIEFDIEIDTNKTDKIKIQI